MKPLLKYLPARQSLSLRKVILVCVLPLLFLELIYQTSVYLTHRSEIGNSGNFKDVNTHSVKTGPADDGLFRVIILGGSAAAGFGNDPKNNFGYLLQEKIAAALPENARAEVVILARGAQTSIDDYTRWIKEGAGLNPEVVIIYTGWNDITAFVGNPGWIVHHTREELLALGKRDYGDSAIERYLDKSLIAKRFLKFRREVEERISEVYLRIRQLRKTFHEFLAGHLPPAPVWFTRKANEPPSSFSEVLNVRDIWIPYDVYPKYNADIKKTYQHYYESNLRRLASAFTKDQIKSLFVFQPDLLFKGVSTPLNEQESSIATRLFSDKSELWRAVLGEYFPLGSDIARKTAFQHGHSFIDLNVEMQSVPDWSGMFMDSVHNTEKGNAWIADRLFLALRPWLPSRTENDRNVI